MKSTQLTEAVSRTEEIADIMISSLQSRRRRCTFGVPMMRRNGARFTTLRGMIWKSEDFSRLEEDVTTSNASVIGAPVSRPASGSMSIASKTQRKKLQHEISLA
jgi:hypothetical protein